MIRILTISQSQEWDSIVRSFSNYDIYYLSGYVRAYEEYGDGEACLLYYEGTSLRAIYVFIKRQTIVAGLFDSVTPYGYGGILFDGDASQDNLNAFWTVYVAKMSEENIVDNFVRYHPVLGNASIMKSVAPIYDLGKTVAIDLISSEDIWHNLAPTCQNRIRKAQKNGVVIKHSHEESVFNRFSLVYNSTMERHGADKYYFFNDAYYNALRHGLEENVEIFYAEYEGKMIAACLLLFVNGQLHYHLAASLSEYHYLAPSNLMIYEAALWGLARGCKTFHLGGGVGSDSDNLLRFKKTFSKKHLCQFSIGKEIFDESGYSRIVQHRIDTDPSFNPNNSFFPVYRG